MCYLCIVISQLFEIMTEEERKARLEALSYIANRHFELKLYLYKISILNFPNWEKVTNDILDELKYWEEMEEKIRNKK